MHYHLLYGDFWNVLWRKSRATMSRAGRKRAKSKYPVPPLPPAAVERQKSPSLESTSGRRSRSRSANKSGSSTPGRRTRSRSTHNSVESTSGRRSRSRSANKSRKNASRCSSRSQPRNKSSASVEGASGRSRATAALASTHVSGYLSAVCSSLCMCVAWQVAYLGIVGGKSEDDTIERVLSATLSSQLAIQFNWNGLRGKKCFRNLELCNVVFGMSSKNVSSCLMERFTKCILWYLLCGSPLDGLHWALVAMHAV